MSILLADVKCTIAVDNLVAAAYLYRDDGQREILELKSEGLAWGCYVTFEQTNADERGSIMIEAADIGDSNNRCYSAGIVVQCEASDKSSPWHNFQSNVDHWYSKDGNDLCSNDNALFLTISATEWVNEFQNNGAHHLWVDGNEEVTLIGSPWKNADIHLSCKHYTGTPQ